MAAVTISRTDIGAREYLTDPSWLREALESGPVGGALSVFRRGRFANTQVVFANARAGATLLASLGHSARDTGPVAAQPIPVGTVLGRGRNARVEKAIRRFAAACPAAEQAAAAIGLKAAVVVPHANRRDRPRDAGSDVDRDHGRSLDVAGVSRHRQRAAMACRPFRNQDQQGLRRSVRLHLWVVQHLERGPLVV